MRRRLGLLLIAVLVLAACRTPSPEQGARKDVEVLLSDVELKLRERNSDAAMGLFASDAYLGSDDIRRQLESFWRSNRLSQMQFWVDSTHRQDGLLLVKTHWQRVVLDAGGRPVRSAGRSDFLLRDKKPLRILEVRGDPVF